MFNVKNILDSLCFDHPDFEKTISRYSATNPHHVSMLLKNEDLKDLDLSALKAALVEHNAQAVAVSAEDIKSVYLALKNREHNPSGKFDKSGRFYITDYDLVDCREPSSKYPYSQMNAARSAKFVKALAEKYKCKNKQELESVAFA